MKGARKFCSLQKERAEKSANFLFLIFIFGSKTKEIRPKTLGKWPKKADFGTFPYHMLKIRNLPPPNHFRHGQNDSPTLVYIICEKVPQVPGE